MDLESFEGLGVNSIRLGQDHGYSINIDADRWQVNINRDGSGSIDRDKYDDFGLDDVLDKDELVDRVDSFLDEYNIDISDSYEDIVWDDSWKDDLADADDPENFYIPTTARMVFPIRLEEYDVYGLADQPEGLNISYDMIIDKVTSLGPLESIYLKAYEYAISKDIDSVLENTHNSESDYIDEDVVVQLNGARLVYTSMYEYDDGETIKYYVPAVYFDIVEWSEDVYTPDSLVLPLLEEVNI